MKPPARLDALTGVRGIAAWLVVLFHIRFSLGDVVPLGMIAVLGKGYLAVDLFFVLSGFVIWLNYGAALASGDVRGFLIRRLARIYPLHLVMMAVAAALAGGLALAGHPNDTQFDWRTLPFHLFLIHNWGFSDQLGWNDPSWSISAEWGAYLLLPLAAPLIGWRGWTPVRAGVMIVALASGLYAWMAFHGATTLGADVPRFGLVRCLFEFAMGAMLCRVWQQVSAIVLAQICGAVLAFVLAGVIVGVPETLGVPVGFAALVGLLAATSGWRGNIFETRALVWLGEVSYATYLVHFILWIVVKLLFVRDVAHVPIVVVLGYLVTTLLLSVVLYHWIERPGRRLINRWA